MAFDVLDEHEQGEMVRKWLRENALALAGGIGMGLVLIFGWQQWGVHKVRKAEEAATEYRSLVTASEAGDAGQAEALAASLRDGYSGTVYAVLAALRQADMAADAGNLDEAADALEWARANASGAALKGLVDVRLARVRLAAGDAAAALNVLNALPADSYPALREELLGDAFLASGQRDQARAAYQQALGHQEAGAPGEAIVRMKLESLAAPDAVVSSAAPASAADHDVAQGS